MSELKKHLAWRNIISQLHCFESESCRRSLVLDVFPDLDDVGLRHEVLLAASASYGWVVWQNVLLCPTCWHRGKRQVMQAVSRMQKGAMETLETMLRAQFEMEARFRRIGIEAR